MEDREDTNETDASSEPSAEEERNGVEDERTPPVDDEAEGVVKAADDVSVVTENAEDADDALSTVKEEPSREEETETTEEPEKATSEEPASEEAARPVEEEQESISLEQTADFTLDATAATIEEQERGCISPVYAPPAFCGCFSN